MENAACDVTCMLHSGPDSCTHDLRLLVVSSYHKYLGKLMKLPSIYRGATKENALYIAKNAPVVTYQSPVMLYKRYLLC